MADQSRLNHVDEVNRAVDGDLAAVSSDAVSGMMLALFREQSKTTYRFELRW